VTAAVRGAPWVVCDHVCRVYPSAGARLVAVDDVSLTIAGGTRVALTGPSGSGKSTLLHLIAGLETPTAGRVDWPGLGLLPVGRPASVGMVFQSPSLVPDLDVAENVGLPLVLGDRGYDPRDPELRAIVAEALQQVGIPELATKLPEELSGGQAQRAALARVLVGRPRLILADEPTGQLDGATGLRIVSDLLATADELDAALVVSTHDSRVAERLEAQWSMRDGRLTTTAGAVSPPDPMAEVG
jgi:ABC-type lipoprotein export system ATPase subunit